MQWALILLKAVKGLSVPTSHLPVKQKAKSFEKKGPMSFLCAVGLVLNQWAVVRIRCSCGHVVQG